MEEKAELKNLLEDEEKPYDNSTATHNGTDEPSFDSTMRSTLLSLSLNNSGQPHTQMSMLRIKLEEAKKENKILKAMLNQVNKHCTELQNRILSEMKQHQLSSSPCNNNHDSQGNKQEAEKPMLQMRQFLTIGESSVLDGNTEACASAESNIEMKILGRNHFASNNTVEAEINSQITSHEAKHTQDNNIIQASEVTCRRAKVSIRARSDFSLMGDGCQWRKYGQKTAKGNPCPRAYYRCSMGTSCPVRKQVQRCFKDETVVITSYEGNHNHPLPPAARPLASTTSAALNMFLSGSITSSHSTITTLPNSPLFSSLSSTTLPPAAVATFSHSATCPTITLDFTQPLNNNNYLQFQRTTTSQNHMQSLMFPLPFHGHHQISKLPTTMLTPEKNLALVDVVSEAITKDPSLKAALFSAISSLTTGDDPQKNINNHTQHSGYDPCSKMPAIPPHQPYTTQLI